MITLLVVNAAITLLGSAILFPYYGAAASLAFAVGSGVTFANNLGLVVVWPRILAKKQVALAITGIVFKFAILGWIIYAVLNGDLLHKGWFAAGMAVVLPSVLATAFMIKPIAEESAVEITEDTAAEAAVKTP